MKMSETEKAQARGIRIAIDVSYGLAVEPGRWCICWGMRMDCTLESWLVFILGDILNMLLKVVKYEINHG